MKNILVPTDFSKNGENALDFAMHLAHQFNGEIILIHACNNLHTTSKNTQELNNFHNSEMTDNANRELSLLKKGLVVRGVVAQIKLYVGDIVDSILQACEDYKIDVIVMGSVEKTGMKEKIFGSKTTGVVGKAGVPVMVIPEMARWSVPKNILLAVNNIEVRPEITSMVFELGGLFDATVHIAIFTFLDSMNSADQLKHKKNMSAFIDLESYYKTVKIKSALLDGYNFKRAIYKYIDDEKIDIIAMLTQKETFFENLMDGRNTQKMSATTRVPLLCMPAVKKSEYAKKNVEENLDEEILG